MTERKIDRRRLLTKQMIKDALLELLYDTPYDKITVTALSKQAEVTRATFYLHFANIDEVLDELLDDALRLTELTISPLSSDSDRDAMLPACQRAASDPKYRILFLDEGLSHHILHKLYHAQRAQQIPDIMQRYHLTEWEAEKIFLFLLHGNFAVNKSLGWQKSDDWYHAQQLIQDLIKP